MTAMKPVPSLVALLILLTTCCICLSQTQEKKPDDQAKISRLMKKKLEFSQNVLAGLTEGDFDKISHSAEMLNVVSYLGKGTHADLEDYQRQLTYFDMANQELIRNARKKNIDGATLWYNLLTTSCVQCHTIVRGAKK
jgi:hypothetical protein